MKDPIQELNDEITSFAYDKHFLPDEMAWLLLALPVEDKFGKTTKLRIPIPKTIVFGLRKDGVYLYNDERGYVVHKCLSAEECIKAFDSTGQDVIAYEKEMSIQPMNNTQVKEAFRCLGMYKRRLVHKTFRRLIADTFKQIQASQYRNFSVRERIVRRHGKYKKKPFTRVAYRLYGKTTILALSGVENSEKEETEKNKAMEHKVGWRQLVRGVSACNIFMSTIDNQSPLGRSSSKLKHMSSNVSKDEVKKAESEKKMSMLHDLGRTISYESLSSKQGIASKAQLAMLQREVSDLTLRDGGRSVMGKKKSDNIWSVDAEEDDQEDKDENLNVRYLETVDSRKYRATEIMPYAAPDLLEMTKSVVEHINHLARRHLSHFVVDFVKDSQNRFVLNEIVAFQFDQPEELANFVVRRPKLVKYRIEDHFKCDLDEVDSETLLKDSSVNDDDDGEAIGPRAKLERLLNAKDRKLDDGHLQTPNTALCRMCNSRINSTSSRYHVTSTMIYSTVMHLRARLPVYDWPHFCTDNSYTMLSMQRNIKSAIDDGPKLGSTTEANLFLCQTCYRLYQEETNLIQVEYQIGVLTRSQSAQSSSDPLGGSPSTPKKGGSMNKRNSTSPMSRNPSAISIDSGFHSRAATNVSRPSSAPSQGRKATGVSGVGMKRGSRKSRAPTDLNNNIGGGGNNHNTTPKLSMFSSASRPSLQSPGFTRDDLNPVHSPSGSTRGSIASAQSPPQKPRNTMYQLSRPKQLAEGYAESFYRKKANASEVLSESDIRDKFRDKNNPSNHSVVLFGDHLKRKKEERKKAVEKKEAYPKPTDPPRGTVISRSDLPLQLTVCRLAVNIHEITDLPVAFFEAYENFSICYLALGRRVDARCERNSMYKRHKQYKFKEATGFKMTRWDDSDNGNSTSSLSSTSSPGGSDTEDEKTGCSEEEEEEDEFDTCSGSEKEVVVGSLDCRLFKVSYVLINGDAKAVEYHEPLSQFFQDFKSITVVLCADLKPNAVIGDNNWKIPTATESRQLKSSKLKSKFRGIREDAKAMGSSPSLQQSQSFDSDQMPSMSAYEPRTKIDFITESGILLPGNAIAYGDIPLEQFRGNTVKRLDIGIPLSYSIRHLPLARTVPMLKGMIGFDRALFPVDIWALPYSILQLKERNAFVPLVEDQFSLSIPLPMDWVNVKVMNADAQRKKAMFKSRNSLVPSTTDASSSKKRLDIDAAKRSAPTLVTSQARQEVSQMFAKKHDSSLSVRKDLEVELEREPGSIWSLSISITSAHHIHRDEDFFSMNKRSFECSFAAFGETSRVRGEVVGDDGDISEVKFDANETKYLFSASVSALEALFETMEPILVQFEPVESDEGEELPQFARVVSAVSSPAKGSRPKSSKKLPPSASTVAFLTRRKSSGYISLQNIHKERYVETSVPVTHDMSSGETIRHSEMYPPYANVVMKLHRVGPPTFEDCGSWLPPRMRLGEEVEREVHKLVYTYK